MANDVSIASTSQLPAPSTLSSVQAAIASLTRRDRLDAVQQQTSLSPSESTRGNTMSIDGQSEDEAGNGKGDAKSTKPKNRRTRNGCLVCRKRKKLCDEQKPACGACSRLSLHCEWEDRVQAALERRQRRIDKMRRKEKEKTGIETAADGDERIRPAASADSGMATEWTSIQVDGESAAYNPSAPNIFPAFPASPAPLPPSSLPLQPFSTSQSALESPTAEATSANSWMPFLGSFAPAGYEPAAAPDPLAWSAGWPSGFGYPPFGQTQPYPLLSYPALEPPLRLPEGHAAADEQRDQILDLDAIARLEDVQTDMVLQAQGYLTQDPEGGASAPAVEGVSPTGSSPPFDLFALLRSPSPVHPFASSAAPGSAAGLSFPLDLSTASSWTAPSQAALLDGPDPRCAIKATPGDAQLATTAGESSADPERGRGRQMQVGQKGLPALVGHAASFLASADWAFTQAYLLSHYTSSLARLVSIASSPSSSGGDSSSGSDRSRSRRGRFSLNRTQPHDSPRPGSSHSRPRDSATARSTRASANLFLSLVPLANRHPYLLHAILAWSAANLAAASSNHGQAQAQGVQPGSPPSQSGGNSVMATLSDQLGHLADEEISAALPELETYAARRKKAATTRAAAATDEEPPKNWEVLLAARLMLTQAAICQGAVDLWRVRLGEAAHIINLVGGVQKCRSPLARQLVKNLLYHDVLSSTSRRDGLLLDYSFLRHHGSMGGTPSTATASGTSPAGASHGGDGDASTPGETDEERRRREAEEDEEDVLDTLMGCAESVFLLVGRITSLAKEKRQALLSSDGSVAEDDLATFSRQIDELRSELEREKERMDAFLIERPDLEPHRYFHEVFRLAALVYLEMLLELPPTSYPILLLVRKMLSLTEVIVSEGLPGLCSMHWPLFLMHLNSTPLISPHHHAAAAVAAPSSSSTSSPAASASGDPPRAASATSTNAMIPAYSDRSRSTALFDAHMHEFTFMNTKRSRALIDEAWLRSEGGRKFVDPDAILDEWKWDLNWA
ncbi:hypothetical protein BMF94_4862 [Rhodotorula taiwanensis]|uniref:Zn(2)-C6 fungal-type domain-containing protein n=1 Tax=Rhodotorula taiwanensis TaxID=741276 RepID=A0A2S5B5R9_9BASI|nr:hypothetical protein BMF94_4862 [Rhodotorula taiwanensis]